MKPSKYIKAPLPGLELSIHRRRTCIGVEPRIPEPIRLPFIDTGCCGSNATTS